MSDDGRLVYDGWYWWKARVIEVATRRGPRWRAVLDRHFGRGYMARHWLDIKPAVVKGRKRKDKDAAIADAHAMLDVREQDRQLNRGERV